MSNELIAVLQRLGFYKRRHWRSMKFWGLLVLLVRFALTSNAQQVDQIAFYAGGDEGGIVLIDADGSNERRLAIGSEIYDEIVWSPLGDKLAFVQADAEDRLNIFVINADGTGELNLTGSLENDSDSRYASWSPDGAYIYFASDASGSSELYRADVDGGSITRITDGLDVVFPVLSPDGSAVVFYGSRGCDLCLINVDGTGMRELVDITSPFDDIRSIRWSPDSSRILFRSYHNLDGSYHLRVVNRDGTGLIQLTDNRAWDLAPEWSPDGEKIAFRSGEDAPQIYLINPNGSDETFLTQGNTPQWSPDGTRIAFSRFDSDANSENLLVRNLNDGSEVRIYEGVSDPWVWRPLSLPVGPPVLDPDSVANGASYLPGLVPGSWGQIKGTNLSTTTRIWNESDFGDDSNLPTSLDGVELWINNLPAAIYYISPTQISFQVPAGLSGEVMIHVVRGGVASEPIVAEVVDSAPALFTYIAGETRYPAAVYAGTANVVGDPEVSGNIVRKAMPSDHISLYATGLVPSPAGVLVGVSGVEGVTVTIGDVPAVVEFAGLVAPGQFQINIIVPELAQGDYSIKIRLDDRESQSGVWFPIL